ncbi:hypothetical protein Pan44_31830 [Caulifigura coniformis]|uniref:Carboxypeptidase regulatory-like domain-containing protein n=1 Tax=Caulifigura coniformis TaxID=2527983 RepID=A0A517SG86_9PLAN|nr:hypothetical protein [Caulifigura coniformis]QDT55141.1 hypothetical protein Pan44_31830 [Caulifigura coniformis]
MNLRLLLVFASLLSFTGCGPGQAYEGASRFPLSGKVTFDGKPVDGGSISFIPTTESNRVSGAPISQGTYTVPEEKGANAGEYRVEIRWPQPTGKKYKDPDTLEMLSEFKESVPKKYNEQSELKAEVSDANRTFDFDLKK